MENCPLDENVCRYPELSLNFYTENFADKGDSTKKIMGKWASQLRECQQCPELKRSNS
jgi:hypothetical protein